MCSAAPFFLDLGLQRMVLDEITLLEANKLKFLYAKVSIHDCFAYPWQCFDRQFNMFAMGRAKQLRTHKNPASDDTYGFYLRIEG